MSGFLALCRECDSGTCVINDSSSTLGTGSESRADCQEKNPRCSQLARVSSNSNHVINAAFETVKFTGLRTLLSHALAGRQSFNSMKFKPGRAAVRVEFKPLVQTLI